jgi:hypothetical protein
VQEFLWNVFRSTKSVDNEESGIDLKAWKFIEGAARRTEARLLLNF